MEEGRNVISSCPSPLIFEHQQLTKDLLTGTGPPPVLSRLDDVATAALVDMAAMDDRCPLPVVLGRSLVMICEEMECI